MTVSKLEEHIGYWLRIVSNQIHVQFSNKLEKEKITVAEWVILRKLFEQESWSQIDLVAATGLTKGAISKLVERLRAKNLLIVSLSPDDMRVNRLKLSTQGNRLVPKIAVLADINDNEFFDCLSKEERKHIIELMKRIIQSKKIKNLATK